MHKVLVLLTIAASICLMSQACQSKVALMYNGSIKYDESVLPEDLLEQ